MGRLYPLLTFCLLLTACFDAPGVLIYDTSGNKAGSVSVSGETATIYDRNGYSIGKVKGDTVYDDDDRTIGEVQGDGDIVGTDGYRKGRIEGKRCENRDGYEAGTIASDIDDEAAGGACLLLLL